MAAESDSDSEWLRELLGAHRQARRASNPQLAHHPDARSAEDLLLLDLALPRESRRSRSPKRSAVQAAQACNPSRSSRPSRPSCSSPFTSVGMLLDEYPESRPLPTPRQNDIVTSFLESSCPRCPQEVVKSCLGRLASWYKTFNNVMVFKVGIAADPAHRFFNRDFGYCRDQMWMHMDLVFKGSAEECRQLEMSLISQLSSLGGCYNDKPGGEGVQAGASHECYTYFIMAPCGEGLSLRSAFLMRMSIAKQQSVDQSQKSECSRDEINSSLTLDHAMMPRSV